MSLCPEREETSAQTFGLTVTEGTAILLICLFTSLHLLAVISLYKSLDMDINGKVFVVFVFLVIPV